MEDFGPASDNTIADESEFASHLGETNATWNVVQSK